MVVDTVLGRGLLATLDRVNGGGQVVTDRQINASLELENAQLKSQLAWASEEIRRLKAQLASLNATGQAEELITFTEAARRERVAVSTISRWVQRGHIELRHVGGRAKPYIVAHTLKKPPRKSRKGAA